VLLLRLRLVLILYGVLGLQVDYKGAHASIRPATAKELAAWAASKAGLANGGNTNINTKKVQASVRGIE